MSSEELMTSRNDPCIPELPYKNNVFAVTGAASLSMPAVIHATGIRQLNMHLSCSRRNGFVVLATRASR